MSLISRLGFFATSRPTRRVAHRRPRIELLEDRLTPSSFHVTPTADDGASGSLRAAIAAAGAANGESVIHMAPGTYHLTQGVLDIIGGKLRLSADGAGSATVEQDTPNQSVF